MEHPFDALEWPSRTDFPTKVKGDKWKSDPYLNGAVQVKLTDDGSLTISLNLSADVVIPVDLISDSIAGIAADDVTVMVIERALIDLRELMPAMSALIQAGYNPPKGNPA